jgi:hypothetical protein
VVAEHGCGKPNREIVEGEQERGGVEGTLCIPSPSLRILHVFVRFSHICKFCKRAFGLLHVTPTLGDQHW